MNRLVYLTKLCLLIFGMALSTTSAQFTYGTSGNQVLLSSISSNEYYSWNFGDQTTSNVGPNVTHLFSKQGIYQVSLTAWNKTGRSRVSSLLVTAPVNQVPVVMVDKLVDGCNVDFDASKSYDPDGQIVSCVWTFGDGKSYSTDGPKVRVSHTYTTKARSYIVTVTCTDNSRASSSKASDVNIIPPPTARFYYMPRGNYVILNGMLSSSFGSPIKQFVWNFADKPSINYTTTATSISHWFPSMGSWLVKLTVVDGNGLAGSTEGYIRSPFNFPPVALFTSTSNEDTVVTTGSASLDLDGYVEEYQWDFGDRTAVVHSYSGSDRVRHTYNRSGRYDVTLRVYDNNGAFDETRKKVNSNALPIAGFTASSSGDGHMLKFDGTQLSYDRDGQLVGTAWAFGDGGTNSTYDLKTSHYYLQAGYYNVSLQVTDDFGGAATTRKVVLANSPPRAVITVLSNTNDTLRVSSQDCTDPDGYLIAFVWNFGDSETSSLLGSSAPAAITHSYKLSGYYNISLKVTDNFNTSSDASLTILVNTPPSPVLKLVGKFNDSVVLNADLTSDTDGLLRQLILQFGDGINRTYSTMPIGDIFHTYTLGGFYALSLVAVDNFNATATVGLTVFVNTPPEARFTVNYDINNNITLNASESNDLDGRVVNYSWSFGDTVTSRGPGAVLSHTYSRGGVYNVCLEVYDNLNYSSISCQLLTVNTPPVPAFELVSSFNDTILLNALGSYDPDGEIVSYAWNWGDGCANFTSGTSPTANHTYRYGGSYNVTLEVRDNCNATNAVSLFVTVDTPPIVHFDFVEILDDWLVVSAQTITLSDMNDFPDRSGYTTFDPDGVVEHLSWDFGDGSPPITNTKVAVQSHRYTLSGNYTVTLGATDNLGVSSFITKFIVINRPPVPHFSVDQQYNDTILLNASASFDYDGRVKGFIWELGDNSTIKQEVPTLKYTYKLAGRYNVCLNVVDDMNQTSFSLRCMPVEVNTPPFIRYLYYDASTASTNSTVFLWVNATAAFDSDGYIETITWDFGDATSPEVTLGDHALFGLSHSFPKPGCYVVGITAQDNSGATTSFNRSVCLVNPVPSFIIMSQINDTVSFDAAGSTDAQGSIKDHIWDFGDGSPLIRSASMRQLQHTYRLSGTYVVSLVVVNNLDYVSADAYHVEVTVNTPPSASGITILANSSNGTLIVVPEAFDNDGSLVRFCWTFDNTTQLCLDSNQTIQHYFQGSGVHTITLEVTDNDFGRAAVSRSVYVVDNLPIPNFVWTYSANFLVHFDASASSSPSLPGYTSNAQLTYLWKFGSEGTSLTTNDTIISHTFPTRGIFNVSLTVIGPSGLRSSRPITLPVVVGKSPLAGFGVKSADSDGSITFTSNIGLLGLDGNRALFFEWNFGDTSETVMVSNSAGSNSSTITHRFPTAGFYKVNFAVTDDLANNSTCSLMVYAQRSNQEVMAAFTDPTSVQFGTTRGASSTSVRKVVPPTPVINYWTLSDPNRIYLTGMASYASGGDIIGYFWETTQGVSSHGVNCSLQLSASTAVSLTVMNEKGLSAKTTAYISLEADLTPTIVTSALPVFTSLYNVNVGAPLNEAQLSETGDSAKYSLVMKATGKRASYRLYMSGLALYFDENENTPVVLSRTKGSIFEVHNVGNYYKLIDPNTQRAMIWEMGKGVRMSSGTPNVSNAGYWSIVPQKMHLYHPLVTN
jgi:PKD repeat protein